MIAPAGPEGGFETPRPRISKVATASLFPAWAGIAVLVIGFLTGSIPSLFAAMAGGSVGVVVAVAAYVVIGRDIARVAGRMRAFRALVLSLTAIGFAAPRVSTLLALESARLESEAARQLFHAVEKRIEDADSVSVRGRCDAYDQNLHFTILIGRPNRALIRLNQTVRDETSFTKELICDGTAFQYLENGVPVHEGPAPPLLAAHLRKVLLRLQFQDGPFLGRGQRPFRAAPVDGREFTFPPDIRGSYPASEFRFLKRPEPAPFPNGMIAFTIRAGPEARRETLDIDRNSGLPWRRTSEYWVGSAGWSRQIGYDEFVLNQPLDPDSFARRGTSR